MMTIDEMQDILEELVANLPEVFFDQLNGGILLLEDTVLSPEALDDDLYTMGEYCEDPIMGSYIVLYYGSFAQVCDGMSDKAIREEIRTTLLHEFTHHLESRSGERSLEIEDEQELAQYLSRKSKKR